MNWRELIAVSWIFTLVTSLCFALWYFSNVVTEYNEECRLFRDYVHERVQADTAHMREGVK